jgi:hypothetical protein
LNLVVENTNLRDAITQIGILLELANGDATRADAMTALDNLGQRGDLVVVNASPIIPMAAGFFAETRVGYLAVSGVNNVTINAYLAGIRQSAIIAANFTANPIVVNGLTLAPWPDIIRRLAACEAVLLAGHSYGGVVIDAIDLQLPKVRARPRTLITFGSPRAVPDPSVADRSFARRVNVRNLGDGVPFFPPSGEVAPPISLLIAQLLGEWPFNFCTLGETYLQDGARPWVRPDPGVNDWEVGLLLTTFGLQGMLTAGSPSHALRNYLPPAVMVAPREDACWLVETLPTSDPVERAPAPSQSFRQFAAEAGFTLPRYGSC